jgi:peptidoglycan hydrolase-like protein with peptidoglycan-binding domain
VSWWVWQHARPEEWSAIAAPLTVPQRVAAAPQPPAPATLRPGATGDPVRWLQLRLRAHGSLAPLNARFDRATAAAVLSFKATKLLPALPVVDPATWAALIAPPVSAAPIASLLP